ncbi:hypothetical protein E2562_003451 [Oryza meyeriana var. granulata]|uniref:Uncharacterized protein n=1 Tax=Oryza meyeriana var. granulata TaxID=110450 RepID=A0A6G1EEQ1_9ORYZ|nr:hypothetical protein E2562_003451 [Oryza meyeriana var. granulata]
MARKPRPRRDITPIRSLRDARRVVDMYGDRHPFQVKAAALYGGVRQAGAVHTTLSRQEKRMGWVIRSMWKLERPVAVHKEISIATGSLDDIVLYS